MLTFFGDVMHPHSALSRCQAPALFLTSILALTSIAPSFAAEKLKVALLTPGLTNDGSFNQVAAEAVKRLAAEGLITVEIREKMGDPAASEPVIRHYAARGYDLVIGHGIELSEPILKVAADFPKVNFAASGGPDLAGKLTTNVDGWTYDFGQQGYLGGFVAGRLKGGNLVGMVGGPQLPFVQAEHKGFKAGFKDAGSAAKTTETYTGSFDDAQKAAEATRGMVEQGAKVVWTSGDGIGNGVAAAAASLGAATLGVTGDAGGLARKVNVASVVLDMYPTYRAYIDDTGSTRFGKKFFISGLANKGLVTTPINNVNGLVPSDLQKEIDVLVSDLASGMKTLPNFFQ
jgi:basic membrane lipoprotein Med (substrate-binding protein (PBP1-ABC) superfamily)